MRLFSAELVPLGDGRCQAAKSTGKGARRGYASGRRTGSIPGGIRSVVVRALRETNARDYAPEIIEAVVLSFSPAGIAERMTNRLVLVATLADEIIGTASLHQVRREVFTFGRIVNDGGSGLDRTFAVIDRHGCAPMMPKHEFHLRTQTAIPRRHGSCCRRVRPRGFPARTRRSPNAG
jgi:hypothetical protein